MAYQIECRSCGENGSFPQKRGMRLASYTCRCGGELRRIGWQEMYRRRAQSAAARRQEATEGSRP
ncbi:hypothetical protein BSFA1_79930 (plasmid) [Burkholderia sp. SFA1]|nr:hypothetical protein BSFA1_79930 [Burkholderia sp. SFA1]